MTSNSRKPAGLTALLEGDLVRRAEHEGETVYAAVDVVAAFVETQYPSEYWEDLKGRESTLERLVEQVEFLTQGGTATVEDAVRVEGLLRIVQSISSPKAERIKHWLAASARERIEEAENPELAFLRTRKLYEHKGYSARWVDKRLRGVSARQELTGEWYKRGVTDSEQFRALTNEMAEAAFGMDVTSLRGYKNLQKTGSNLRDHMTGLELALTTLAETIAVSLHRERGSQGFEHLAADAKDAGEIAALTRREIEARIGHALLTRRNAGSVGATRRDPNQVNKAVA